ncbi:choline BCCT transporter BetT [Thiopseudomonas alkaliphila]|uniref:Choline BCCT transporter BetT n=1 Tax=Thiopseudomonas alkaliphila TaxID=1697053 RepID=A0AAW7DR99_9GAMM|nr:choline BCCT transporter BetT [Thiopseudomonas alkaliphila]MDM1695276.1 choline BCCT transporter BetT [Thiopseudomonas alkaliphila]
MSETTVVQGEKATASQVNKTVFYSSAITCIALIVWTIAFPTSSQSILSTAMQGISDSFGWYYMAVVAAYCIFSVAVAFSRFGDIKLGRDHETPDFPFLTWASMLFAAGVGIGFLFFGASEPLAHYLAPPMGEGGTPEAAHLAITQTFLHWGLHGWGIYALMGMVLAFFAYRYNYPLALRSALIPVFGKKLTRGWLGHSVDTFGVVCTLLGIATSLGIGVLQVNAGMDYLFGIPTSQTTQAIIIVAVIAIAGISATTGVAKGVRRLSELNMLGALILVLALLFMGPTKFLLNALVQNIGDYFQTIVLKTFDMYAYEGEAVAKWRSSWTVFFWAWWVAWAPFVGLFIARISRGRRLRDFVFGVMLIPLGFVFVWFSIFGNTAIDLVNNGAVELGEVAVANPQMGLYKLFEHFPMPIVWSGFAMLIGMTFFITSADSGSLVLANLSSKSLGTGEDAPVWLRLFWAAATGLVTLGLLFTGEFGALQSVSVIAGLPFSLILLVYMIAMAKCLVREGNRMKAGRLSIMPAANMQDWRGRLNRIVNFPTRRKVQTFMMHKVHEAMESVQEALSTEGIESQIKIEEDKSGITFEVMHQEEVDFIYQVWLVESQKPSFVTEGENDEPEAYFRAEVFLREGSLDYDLVGYTQDQIINDILNHYERHMQFLHLER